MYAQELENSTLFSLLYSEPKQPTQTRFLPFIVAALGGPEPTQLPLGHSQPLTQPSLFLSLCVVDRRRAAGLLCEASSRAELTPPATGAPPQSPLLPPLFLVAVGEGSWETRRRTPLLSCFSEKVRGFGPFYSFLPFSFFWIYFGCLISCIRSSSVLNHLIVLISTPHALIQFANFA